MLSETTSGDCGIRIKPDDMVGERGFVRPGLAALLGVALLAWPFGAARAEQIETERVDRVIALQPGGTLKLKNFSGEVRIAASDRNEVVIHAVRRAPRERLDRITLDIQSSESTVTIEANRKESSWLNWSHSKNNVVETDFEIQVPRKTNLEVAVFSSPVNVTDVEGRHDIHSFSSNLRLQNLAGPIRVKTFSGDIEIWLARSEARPRLEIDTFSGDVDVRMPETAQARVAFRSFSGDLESDMPLTLRSKTRRTLVAELNGGGGGTESLRFKTFSGDVRIRR